MTLKLRESCAAEAGVLWGCRWAEARAALRPVNFRGEMSEIENTPYERLKALQHEIQLERGRKPPIKDLIVLASQNDPFYAGTERQRAMAEWFAGIFGQTTGVH
jgi:hypothetical protein